MMTLRWVSAVLLLSLVSVDFAQAGLDFERGGGRWVKLAYQHGSLAPISTDIADANLLLAGRITVTDQAAIRLELPFTRLSTASLAGAPRSGVSTSVMGNIYIAVDVPKDNGKGTWEFGVWLPTAPNTGGDANNALLIASITDFVAGLERYVPETRGAQAMTHIEEGLLAGALDFRGAIGVSVVDQAASEWKAYLMLGGELGAGLADGPRVAVALQSRTSLGDVDDNLAFVDMVLKLEFGGAVLRPAAEFRRPLDDDRSVVHDWTIGLALTAVLP